LLAVINQLNKIYVEVSDLLECLLLGKSLTGISRVILHSLVGFVTQFGEERVRLLAYDSLNHKMREESASLLHSLYQREQQNSLFSKNPLGLSLICQFWSQAAPSSGDVLFHAGNWWWRPAALKAFEKLKDTSGSRATFFIHDLIPIVRPEFVATDHVEKFKSGFENLAQMADQLITSSQLACDDIVQHLRKIGVHNRTVEQVPLADEFMPLPPFGFHLVHFLTQRLKTRREERAFLKLMTIKNMEPFVLVIGTLENRKNVPLILNAWISLEATLGKDLPHLVLVGKWGQGADKMKDFLNVSQNVNGRTHVLNDVSDTQLEQLYRSCEFTVSISNYEGWGLPIGESLWFGKNVLVPKEFNLRPDMSNLISPLDAIETRFVRELKILLKARMLNAPGRNSLRSLSDFQRDLSAKIIDF
jgi:glycosyltransferase involved in cell wall biosynthesis